jgi:hypothetical protein
VSPFPGNSQCRREQNLKKLDNLQPHFYYKGMHEEISDAEVVHVTSHCWLSWTQIKKNNSGGAIER